MHEIYIITRKLNSIQMLENIGIIFDEGPIARCLVEIFKREKIVLNELIYLGKRNIFPKDFYINFNSKYINSKPIKYLNNLELNNFIIEVEKYFDLGANFFAEAYSNKNLKENTNNFYYVKNKNINSQELLSLILNTKSNFLFNSGKQIYREILNSEKKFLHIHPAILPDIKGADGSLWNIKKRNSFGASLFIINKNIDEGEIIFKKEIEIKKFNLKNKFSSHFYDIWFSFVDPAIRCYLLKQFIKSKKNTHNVIKNIFKGEYFSYMDIKLRQTILKSILSSNEQ